MKRVLTELDERFPNLFEPSAILPAQFFAGRGRRTEQSGERRLLAAILELALADASGRHGRRRLRDAAQWFRNEDRTWALSFLRICDELDLDPSAIRSGIATFRRGRARTAPVEGDLTWLVEQIKHAVGE
jgi:hypothetical protein